MDSFFMKAKDSKKSSFDDLLDVALVGRQNELNEIITTIQNDDDFLITGAPGIGRSPLVKKASEESNARQLIIDCFRSSNGQEFIDLLIDEIYQSFSEDWNLVNKVLLDSNEEDSTFLISSLSTKENKVRLSENMSQSMQEKAFQLAVSSLQRLVEETSGRAVIVFKRFYNIRSWDRQGYWEKFLRKKIHMDAKVSYVILGTIAEAKTEEEEEATRSDDERIKVIKLKPLTRGVLTAWARRALENHNLKFSLADGALDLFLDTVQGHIGEARTLVNYIVSVDIQNPEREIRKDDVHQALSNLVKDFSVVFESLLLMLPYAQLQLLECLAVEPTSKPHGKEYRVKYGLARGGTLQAALKGLQQKGLIYDSDDKYQLTLPLFSHWLRKNRLRIS
jgi:hypothetical protein